MQKWRKPATLPVARQKSRIKPYSTRGLSVRVRSAKVSRATKPCHAMPCPGESAGSWKVRRQPPTALLMCGVRLAGLSSPERGSGLPRQVLAFWPWIFQFLLSCLTIVIAAMRIANHGGSGGHVRVKWLPRGLAQFKLQHVLRLEHLLLTDHKREDNHESNHRETVPPFRATRRTECQKVVSSSPDLQIALSAKDF